MPKKMTSEFHNQQQYMRIKIDGVVYSTKDAQDICSIMSEDFPYPHPKYWEITLYKVDDDHYFLYIYSGVQSKYATKGICSACQKLQYFECEEIIPLTEIQAEQWKVDQEELGYTFWYRV